MKTGRNVSTGLKSYLLISPSVRENAVKHQTPAVSSSVTLTNMGLSDEQHKAIVGSIERKKTIKAQLNETLKKNGPRLGFEPFVQNSTGEKCASF